MPDEPRCQQDRGLSWPTKCNAPLVRAEKGPCQFAGCGHERVDDQQEIEIHSTIGWSNGRPDLTGHGVCVFCMGESTDDLHDYQPPLVCPHGHPQPEGV